MTAHVTEGLAPVHVRAEALTRHFAAHASLLGRGATLPALQDVSFVIRRGGALGVVGESGGGKTTLARTLLRLIEPTAGRAVVDGIDLSTLDDAALRAFRRRAQLVFQESLGALDPRHTVAQAIGEPLLLHDIVERSQVADETARLLEQVGLDPALSQRRPHELSGGQRQRVCIARALASRPALLVADEPTSALDASARAQVGTLLFKLRRELSLTLLVISHDLRLVRHLCDRVAVLYLGRIVEEGASAVIFTAPRHPYTLALLDAAPAWPPAPTRASSPLRLSGEPPSALAPPAGCAFHPRCPRYLAHDRPARCATERPLLVAAVAEGGAVACHFPE